MHHVTPPNPRAQPLPWVDPLVLAASLGDGPMALLYSSARTAYSGARSLLAYGLVESADISDLRELNSLLSQGGQRFSRSWFGYLGYELRHSVERYAKAPPMRFSLPRGRLMRFSEVYEFDHNTKHLVGWSEKPLALPALIDAPALPTPPAVLQLCSPMSRDEYEQKVARVLEAIACGDLYQANLTRKFYGEWQTAPAGLSLFARMSEVTPAPFSAYLRMTDAEILSSSPELFLSVSEQGRVSTRPIKGTARRGTNPDEDAQNRAFLQNSDKNRAENLMITDLMRSDLARVATPGSVQVSELFSVTAHPNVFHMDSHVQADLREGVGMAELLAATFPPGSMTGAPKIRACELCSELENIARGPYSGALGWFGADGAAELSVVIRTLLIQQNRFEFQVGGGIVADSTPQSEWRETMDKALGILKTLGLPPNALESL